MKVNRCIELKLIIILCLQEFILLEYLDEWNSAELTFTVDGKEIGSVSRPMQSPGIKCTGYLRLLLLGKSILRSCHAVKEHEDEFKAVMTEVLSYRRSKSIRNHSSFL